MALRLLVLCAVAAAAFGADAPGTFASAAGFSISPPPWTPGSAGMVSAFSMPAADGFAANVNVMIQPFAGSLAEYDELTKGQFKQMHCTVITDAIKDDCLTFEYTGHMQGRDLHFYSRAMSSAGLVYLATATSLEASSETQMPILKASVDSMALAHHALATPTVP